MCTLKVLWDVDHLLYQTVKLSMLIASKCLYPRDDLGRLNIYEYELFYYSKW